MSRLRTNLDVPTEEVAMTYKQLWMVEDIYRNTCCGSCQNGMHAGQVKILFEPRPSRGPLRDGVDPELLGRLKGNSARELN